MASSFAVAAEAAADAAAEAVEAASSGTDPCWADSSHYQPWYFLPQNGPFGNAAQRNRRPYLTVAARKDLAFQTVVVSSFPVAADLTCPVVAASLVFLAAVAVASLAAVVEPSLPSVADLVAVASEVSKGLRAVQDAEEMPYLTAGLGIDMCLPFPGAAGAYIRSIAAVGVGFA